MQTHKYIEISIGVALVIVTAMAGFLFLQIAEEGTTLIPENIFPIKNKNITVFFAGDVMLDRGIRYYADLQGGNQYIFEKIADFLHQQDLNVVNLEGPITNNPSKSLGSKVGSTNNYFFTFDPSWATTLFENNIKLVNIGNNHIENFGMDGVKQTKKYLDKAGVGYFGAPDYPKTTGMRVDGVDLLFVNYNQFSALDPETEEKQAISNIIAGQQQADLVIVVCHWGEEYNLGVTSEQERLGHAFIDAGADLVIGSHPHVIEPVETYNGKRIYYSLGNFIFDQYFDENVRDAMGVVVSIDKTTKEMQFEEKYFYLQSGGQTITVDK